MAAAPEAASEIPVLTYLYLVLVSFLMWALFRALKAGWKLTFGGVLTGLGNILNYDYRFIHIHFGGPILALEADIENALTAAAHGYEQAMGFWFWEMAHLQLWIVDETWKLTKDLAHWGGWVVHSYVPTVVHGATHTVTSTVRTVVKQTTVIERKSVAVARDVVIPHAGELAWIHKHWKTLTRLVAAAGAIALFPPHAIPKLWHGIDDLRKWRTHANRRLHKLEVATGAVAFAALMGNAMGIPWRCLRPRGSVGRVARALCGVNSALLAALLATSFEAFAILDLCGLIAAEEKLATWFRPLLMDLVDVDEWLIQNCGYSAPAPLTLPALGLPSGSYGVTLNEALDFKLGLAG